MATVGICLNACAAISGNGIVSVFRGALPLLLANVVVLVLISLSPVLSTWLPEVLMGP